MPGCWQARIRLLYKLARGAGMSVLPPSMNSTPRTQDGLYPTIHTRPCGTFTNDRRLNRNSSLESPGRTGYTMSGGVTANLATSTDQAPEGVIQAVSHFCRASR